MTRFVAVIRGVGLLAIVAACAANAPTTGMATRVPGAVVRQGDFDRKALAMAACVAGVGPAQRLAGAFVMADAPAMSDQYPAAGLPADASDDTFAVMGVADRNDSLPLWVVVARDVDAARAHVDLYGGYGGGTPTLEARVWRAVADCGRAG